jgi:DinB family protein
MDRIYSSLFLICVICVICGRPAGPLNNAMKPFLESPNLLQTIVAETEKNSVAAHEVVAGLNETQLNWKPAPEKWSIAQCLEHLTVATEEFEPYFTKAISENREKRRAVNSPAYRPTFLGGLLINYLLPESTKKLRAPKLLKPAASQIAGSLEKFLNQQKRFLDFVRQADGIDYNKTRLRSPVTALMRYSLADAFVLTVVHEQRHLAQARRVRETPGFPN